MTAEDLQLQAEIEKVTADLAALREKRRTEAAAHEQRMDGLKQQKETRDLADAVRELVGPEQDWVAPSARKDVAKLLFSQLKMVDGVPTVIDEGGNPVMGRHGLMTPAELRERFRASHPEFVKHSPATKPTEDSQTSDKNLARLFGSKSEGWYAAKLAQDDIQLYRKLRAIAKERGIK